MPELDQVKLSADLPVEDKMKINLSAILIIAASSLPLTMGACTKVLDNVIPGSPVGFQANNVNGGKVSVYDSTTITNLCNPSVYIGDANQNGYSDVYRSIGKIKITGTKQVGSSAETFSTDPADGAQLNFDIKDDFLVSATIHTETDLGYGGVPNQYSAITSAGGEIDPSVDDAGNLSVYWYGSRGPTGPSGGPQFTVTIGAQCKVSLSGSNNCGIQPLTFNCNISPR